ncbi:zinc finger MYM-type protein 1-like [Aphis craccivora]|uniref:Zinc finger MYM-type protein 1-like n=1 Tax=Aphis craccivora TaxID=307492 RepID=A0A6G0Y1T6_APHCR|nr:zinc finger MYM-type protein 1-like [Aphis craccivora]
MYHNTSASFHLTEQTEAESVLVETLTTENTEVPVASINLFDSSTPDLDLGDLNTGPKQPILKVKYSVQKDAIFCYPCHIFAVTSGDNEETFTKTGFNNWKKLSGAKNAKTKNTRIQKNACSEHHSTAIVQWTEYKKSCQSAAHTEQIKQNREYMKCIIDIVLLLGRQGSAFRGHRENDTSHNKGNFKELCELMSKYYSEFNNKYYNDVTNHSSWLIQNDLINICAENVKSTIIKEIQESGMFSISCDEARCHKQEQLSICIWYPKQLDVQERFLCFVDVSRSKNADALVSALLNFINTSDLDKVPIIGQSYDGANVMSGSKSGVQRKLREAHPQTIYKNAIYVHCMAHRLNLVVVDMSKHLKDARNLFNELEALYITLSQLSDTRWVCRFKSCDALINNYGDIVNVLTYEIDEQESKDVAQAIGVLATIKNFKFIIYLFILHDVLKIINILSVQLQSKLATLGSSACLVNGVKEILEKNRTPEYFAELWEKNINFAENNDISINIPIGSKRRRTETKTLKDYHVTVKTAAENSLCEDDSLKKNYWEEHANYPILDAIIDTCDINSLNLKCEMNVMKNIMKEVNFENIKKHLNEEIFSNLFKIMQVAITLPVRSATCERSFSTMRRINTYVRANMAQGRFTNLGILNIEKDIIVDTEIILNTFSKSNRRIQL